MTSAFAPLSLLLIASVLVMVAFLLGRPVNTIRTAARGADFSECEKRGAMHTGCMLTTRDEAIGKVIV